MCVIIIKHLNRNIPYDESGSNIPDSGTPEEGYDGEQISDEADHHNADSRHCSEGQHLLGVTATANKPVSNQSHCHFISSYNNNNSLFQQFLT